MPLLAAGSLEDWTLPLVLLALCCGGGFFLVSYLLKATAVMHRRQMEQMKEMSEIMEGAAKDLRVLSLAAKQWAETGSQSGSDNKPGALQRNVQALEGSVSELGREMKRVSFEVARLSAEARVTPPPPEHATASRPVPTQKAPLQFHEEPAEAEVPSMPASELNAMLTAYNEGGGREKSVDGYLHHGDFHSIKRGEEEGVLTRDDNKGSYWVVRVAQGTNKFYVAVYIIRDGINTAHDTVYKQRINQVFEVNGSAEEDCSFRLDAPCYVSEATDGTFKVATKGKLAVIH